MSERPKHVVLDSTAALKVFEGMASAMTNADYDPVEIVSRIIDHLSQRKDYEARTEKFLDSFKYLEFDDPTHAEDGLILSNAVAFLLGVIEEGLAHAKVYSEDGSLNYMFTEMFGGDILLTTIET